MKNTIAAVLAGLLFALGLPANATATVRVEEMSTQQAGNAYLAAICVGNDARVTFGRKVWHGQNRISLAEVRARLPQLKRLSGVYARALNKSARMLFNPDAGTWPATVAADVKTMAKSAANESYWRTRQREAANADAWLRFNGRANNASNTGATSARIRAALDLPPPGEGC